MGDDSPKRLIDKTPDEDLKQLLQGMGRDIDDGAFGQPLKRLKSVPASSSDPIEYANQLSAESDRALIILCVGQLDTVLQDSLERDMPSLNRDLRKSLFGFDRPLSSFSAKIRLCRALGKISAEEYRCLEILREMRNACAHSTKPLSFNDDGIAELTENLGIYIGKIKQDGYASVKIANSHRDQKGLRLIFTYVCEWVRLSLLCGDLETRKKWTINFHCGVAIAQMHKSE